MEFRIENVAELARLSLKPEEKVKLEKDLGAILNYMETLSALETQKTAPTSHVMDLENVFRADEVKPSAVRDDALRYAPSGEGKFFKVPKVVDK